MRPALISTMDDELITAVMRFVNETTMTSEDHHVTTNKVVDGPAVSFNMMVPLRVPQYFIDATVEVKDGDKIQTREEFIDGLPELLHELYSHAGLTDLICQISAAIGGNERYIVTRAGAWFMSTPRMLILINEE